MRGGALALSLLFLLAACGGDGGTAADDTATADTVAPADTGADAAPDTAAPDTAAPDTAATDTTTTADSATLDTAGGFDVVTGDKGLGEGCAADSECATGLCLSTSLGRACTALCERESDCDAMPIGMFCLPVRPGVAGCAPEADFPTVPSACAGHGDCAWPLACRADDVGCDLPECLVDGDCGAAEVCEPATRRCQPESCGDDVDCRHPALVCADDQTCAPPACTTNADCGALPNVCQPAQHSCGVGAACEDDDGCFYNERCDGGTCVPDPCWKGCDAGEVCDPGSGWCGAACAGPGAAGCPSGQACLTSAGVCAPNTAPVAEIGVAGAAGPVVYVTVGQAVTLSASASVDPEGEALSYRWRALLAPAGSAVGAGQSLGTAVTASFTPDVSGRFVVTVFATDPAGLDSVEAAVTLLAR